MRLRPRSSCGCSRSRSCRSGSRPPPPTPRRRPDPRSHAAAAPLHHIAVLVSVRGRDTRRSATALGSSPSSTRSTATSASGAPSKRGSARASLRAMGMMRLYGRTSRLPTARSQSLPHARFAQSTTMLAACRLSTRRLSGSARLTTPRLGALGRPSSQIVAKLWWRCPAMSRSWTPHHQPRRTQASRSRTPHAQRRRTRAPRSPTPHLRRRRT
mmetsp:Transcript_62117/g.173500  ORF Transcript_62117/g.173500 Transcript_62117/m.173500 type:complete len:213 (-) Transcript_62117:587-1225(-)